MIITISIRREMQLYQFLETPFELRTLYTPDVSVDLTRGGEFFCEGSVDAFGLESWAVWCGCAGV
jgi:hypothetical protein